MVDVTEDFRCPHCDRLLDTAPMLEAGDCGCRWQHGDVVQNPVTGRHFVAEFSRYTKRCEWLELAPVGYTQLNPPRRCRARHALGGREADAGH